MHPGEEYVQRMRRLAAVARRYGFDLLIVLAAIAAALEVALTDDPLQAPELTTWLAVPASALIVLPLLARRRLPFAAPASVWLLSAAFSFADGHLVASTQSVFVAGMAASFLLGNLRDDVQARLGAAIVVGGAAIVVYNQPGHAPGDFLFVPVVFGIVWVAGFALRERAMQAEAAQAGARVAVAEERTRIARELHDVVAHSISVMVLQVGAVRHRLGEEHAEDSEALEGVERTGRTALTEMRQLLAAMRQDGDDVDLAPQPGLGSLDSMLQEVRRAGLPVRLHVDGDPLELPRAIDLSAYRIIQEGLTNALKHARASQADVLVRYGSDELQIEVRDDGGGSSAKADVGHGLVGVRERVKIYGGDMTATASDGGFVLRTRLPLNGHSR
jgi:signal transduction histidine kinase